MFEFSLAMYSYVRMGQPVLMGSRFLAGVRPPAPAGGVELASWGLDSHG